MAAAHGRCATEGNTRTLLCRIGFLRGSSKPAAGLSGHLPVSQLEYTATQASGLQHLRATYEKYLPDGRSKMKGVAQQADRFTAFEFCPRVPCSGFWRVNRIRVQNTKKSHGGNRGFFLLLEGQLPDFVIAQQLIEYYII